MPVINESMAAGSFIMINDESSNSDFLWILIYDGD